MNSQIKKISSDFPIKIEFSNFLPSLPFDQKLLKKQEKQENYSFDEFVNKNTKTTKLTNNFIKLDFIKMGLMNSLKDDFKKLKENDGDDKKENQLLSDSDIPLVKKKMKKDYEKVCWFEQDKITQTTQTKVKQQIVINKKQEITKKLTLQEEFDVFYLLILVFIK